MRRALFAIALFGGMISGLAGTFGQNFEVGGSLKWPDVPIIDETTEQPQQPPAPRTSSRRQQNTSTSGDQQPVQTGSPPPAPSSRVARPTPNPPSGTSAGQATQPQTADRDAAIRERTARPRQRGAGEADDGASQRTPARRPASARTEAEAASPPLPARRPPAASSVVAAVAPEFTPPDPQPEPQPAAAAAPVETPPQQTGTNESEPASPPATEPASQQQQVDPSGVQPSASPSEPEPAETREAAIDTAAEPSPGTAAPDPTPAENAAPATPLVEESATASRDADPAPAPANAGEPAPALSGEPASADAAAPAPALPTAAPLQAVIEPVSPEKTAQPEERDEKLDKIIGQLLIVGFQGKAADESWPRQVASQIEKGVIGGVFVASENVQSPAQLSALTNSFRRTKAAVAPFIAIDQRGGSAQPLAVVNGFQSYNSAARLGSSNDPLSAFAIYQRMAQELAGRGFNVNFGPVLDLVRDGEADSAAEKDASYGAQPKHVAAFAKAFRLAHHGEGLLTVLKHFPGHVGGTKAIAEAEKDAAAPLEDPALEPYRQLILNGNADIVMIGHQAHPDYSDQPGLPASLSETAIGKQLREKLGFQGLVISEDLQARDFAERFPLEESVVRALRAGNDLLLFSNQAQGSPDLPERVAGIIRQAVISGALSRERLQQSYERVIAAKHSLSPAAREIASAKRNGEEQDAPAR